LIGSDNCPEEAKGTPIQILHEKIKKRILEYKKYKSNNP